MTASATPSPQPVPGPVERAAEGRREHAVRGVVPWVVSVGVHVGLVALGFLVTWSVMRIDEDKEPLRVTADFYTLTYDPLVSLASDSPALQEQLPAPTTPVEALEPGQIEALAASPSDPLHLLVDMPAPPAPGGSWALPGEGESATFVGLSTTNARRIVYVIDASGSMIRMLQVVLEELARSLEALSAAQRFGIVFFQRNEAVVVPPAGELVVATPQAKVQALRWIHDNVIPSGRSNPLAALEAALRLEPDVIFLLSENITGSGQFEIDQADLLALLDTLNPADRAGQRRTRISCVQFLYPDPLDTLRRIADLHGGPRGYKFLDAAELGLVAP